MTNGIVWIASYPKSGNTWVRFLLANLIGRGVENSQDVERLVPDVHKVDSQPRYIENGIGFVKTHFQTSQLPQGYDTVGAVYIVRNPLDVLASHVRYFELAEGSEQASRFVDQFIAHGGYPGWESFGFGTWSQHVENWCCSAQPFRRLVIKYEDLKADVHRELCRIADFAQWKLPPEVMANACRQSSFESLKQMEQRELENGRVGFFGSERRHKSAEYRFMNRGVIGASTRIFSEKQRGNADKVFGPYLRLLEYEV